MAGVERKCPADVTISMGQYEAGFSPGTGVARGYPRAGEIAVSVSCSDGEGSCGFTSECSIDRIEDAHREIGTLLLENCPNFQDARVRVSSEFNTEAITSNTRRTYLVAYILGAAIRDEDGTRQWRTDRVTDFEYGGRAALSMSNTRSHFETLETMGLVQIERSVGVKQNLYWNIQMIDSQDWDTLAEEDSVRAAATVLAEAREAHRGVTIKQADRVGQSRQEVEW